MKFFRLIVVALILSLGLVGCAAETPVEEPVNNVTGTINVYTRDASSGTRTAFEEFVELTDKLTVSAIEVTGNGDMAVKVGEDLNGIGYVSLTTDFAANGITALSYNGVAATEENVLNGTYELARPFELVTRASGDFASEDQELVTLAFVDFLMNSVEGREVVFAAGGIVDVDAGTAWDTLKLNHPVLSKDLTSVILKTGGSTSVEKTLKAALEAFQALTGVQFEMNHTGSSDGFKRTLGSEKDSANSIDLGFASRNFKAEETVELGAATGIYAMDAIVVAVNDENTLLTDSTKELVFNIFSGAVSTWEDASK
jgi:phosphate transport system substrate-binding protein